MTSTLSHLVQAVAQASLALGLVRAGGTQRSTLALASLGRWKRDLGPRGLLARARPSRWNCSKALCVFDKQILFFFVNDKLVLN